MKTGISAAMVLKNMELIVPARAGPSRMQSVYGRLRSVSSHKQHTNPDLRSVLFQSPCKVMRSSPLTPDERHLHLSSWGWITGVRRKAFFVQRISVHAACLI